MDLDERCARLKRIAHSVCHSQPQDQRDDLEQELVVEAFRRTDPADANSYIYQLMRWRCVDQQRRRAREVKTVPLDEGIEVPDGTSSSTTNTLRHPFQHPAARRWIYQEAPWYDVIILHRWALDVMSGGGHGAYVRVAKRASRVVSYVNDSFRKGAHGPAVVELTEDAPVSVEITPDRVARTVALFKRRMHEHAAQFAFART